ncbi:MAG: hypothetical protein E7211_00615 [Clostridium lundense]|nr:hypothetical protein [Clostridium lundense]
MISKKKQEIARLLGMSEKTYREWEKVSTNLLKFEENIGSDLSYKFRMAVDTIYTNKKIMISNSDLGKVVTLPLQKQIEIANKFIENPKEIRNIWKEYFPQKTKITIELNEKINNLITRQAKEKGLSKSEYASQLVMLMTMCIEEDKK